MVVSAKAKGRTGASFEVTLPDEDGSPQIESQSAVAVAAVEEPGSDGQPVDGTSDQEGPTVDEKVMEVPSEPFEEVIQRATSPVEPKKRRKVRSAPTTTRVIHHSMQRR